MEYLDILIIFAVTALFGAYLWTARRGGRRIRSVGASDLRAPQAAFVFGIPHLRASEEDPAAAVQRLSGGRAAPKVTTLPYRTPRPDEFESLTTFLGAQQRSELRRAPKITHLEFRCDTGAGFDALREAYSLAAEVAKGMGGVIQDASTHEYFLVDQWQLRRVGSLGPGTVDVRPHVRVAEVREADGRRRAVTLGMEKFGLPDVTATGHGVQDSPQATALLHLICQSFLEQGALERSGRIALDSARIGDAAFRESMSGFFSRGAGGRVEVLLGFVDWRPGDPRNRIAEVYPLREGADASEVIAALFGGDGAAAPVALSRDEAARLRERLKKQLIELKWAYEKGLRPGEAIAVRVSFPTGTGGTKSLWLEVTGWKGKSIRAVFTSDPHGVPGFRLGSTVEIDEHEVEECARRPKGR